LLEEAGDMGLVIPDPEFAFDDRGDAGTGPDLAPKAVGFRPVREEFGDQRPLWSVKRAAVPRWGRARSASAPPRRAVCNHWLTAARLTPSASAIRAGRQPC
jgi:hypothetical protein